MSRRISRRLDRLTGREDQRTVLTAERVAPVAGTVEGAEPDGRVIVTVNGRDCVSRGPIASRAPGDGAVFSRQERVEGPAAAPGSVAFGSPPPPPPEVVSVDPDVWPVNGTTDVVAAGFFLDKVDTLALRQAPPFEELAYPDVTVDAFYPGFAVVPTGDPEIDGPPNPEVMLMTVTVDDVEAREDRGGVAVGNTGGRVRTDDLYQLGPEAVPTITSLDPPVLWSDVPVFQVSAYGENLSGIDTVQFTHPGPGGGQFLASVVVLAASATELLLELTKGDEFPAVDAQLPLAEADDTDLPWVTTAQPVDFGIGGLQYVSDPLWTTHPPVLPIEAWLLFAEDFPSAGETIAPGLYAYPMPFDPAQPGRVPLAGRSHPLPAALPSTYSPSATATAQGYQGRIDAQWYGGPEGRLIIAERGDALPDGGAGTGNDWGTGTGPWYVVWDVEDGIMHPARTFPTDNRLLGPMMEGDRVSAIVYQEGTGGQIVSADYDGGAPFTGPRFSSGSPPHEAIAAESGFLVVSSWPGVGTPTQAQQWNTLTGARSLIAYSTVDSTTANWTNENKTALARIGDTLRVGLRFARGRAYDYAAGVDADPWPNVPSTAGTTQIPSSAAPASAARGSLSGVGRQIGSGGDPDTVWICGLDAGSAGGINRLISCRVVEAATAATSLTVFAETLMGRTTPGYALAVMAFPPDILPDGGP